MSGPLASSDMVMMVWRVPFADARPMVQAFRPGMTVAEMVAEMDLPPDFMERGVVLLSGHELYRHRWRRTRPKGGARLSCHYPLEGGRAGGGAKAIAGILLAIATVFTAGLASTGYLATAGWFTIGSTSAKVLSMSISLIGGLAASALSKPPARPKSTDDERRGPASLSGNVLAKDSPLPRVQGLHRAIYPPLAVQPLVVRHGKDEVVEAVYALAGPHDMRNLKLGDTPIAEAEDIEHETREGWDDDEPITLVTRYGATQTPSLELSQHVVLGDEQDTIEKVSGRGNLNDAAGGVMGGSPAPLPDVSRSLPKWHSLGAGEAPDEIWLHLIFQGLQLTTSPNQKQVVPFRLRMRASATDPWINLPELHFASASATELKPQIILKWGQADTLVGFPINEGWTTAYKAVAGQADPATTGWQAHASFSKGAGSDVVRSGIEGASNVKNVQLGELTATLYLDPAQIPPGEYEVQIKRGHSFAAPSFNKDGYVYAGTLRDFFSYFVSSGRAKIARSRENVTDRAYVIRLCSVWNRHPIAGGKVGPGLALLALTARNRSVEQVSLEAAGYVRDWDGDGWNDWTLTGNPAPHYVDVRCGPNAVRPLPMKKLDQDELLDWRADCAAKGYELRLVVEGAGDQEVLDRICSVGYAQTRQAALYGVVRDYDRSAEEPTQVFTARNSRGLAMSKAFPILPDAMRVTFKRATDLRRDRTMLVWREGREGVANPRIENARYEGMCDDDQVRDRVVFDLRQAEQRSALWTFRAPIEAVLSRRGDLIRINHRTMNERHEPARIAEVLHEAGSIAGVELDGAVQCWDETDMHGVTNLHGIADMHAIGRRTAVEIRLPDGSVSQHAVMGGSGRRKRLTFAAPATVELAEDDQPEIRPGLLAWIGEPGELKARMVITDIAYGANHEATIVAAPEAPGLWQ